MTSTEGLTATCAEYHTAIGICSYSYKSLSDAWAVSGGEADSKEELKGIINDASHAVAKHHIIQTLCSPENSDN